MDRREGTRRIFGPSVVGLVPGDSCWESGDVEPEAKSIASSGALGTFFGGVAMLNVSWGFICEAWVIVFEAVEIHDALDSAL